MDILRKITIRNLKLNRKRSIMTIAGIILSTALICAVAGMGLSAKKTIGEMTRYENGDFHVILYNIPGSVAGTLAGNENISSVAGYKNVGVASIGKIDYELNVYESMQFLSVEAFDEKALDVFAIHLSSGEYPENENEIILPEQYLTISGADYKIGDTISLTLGKRYDQDGNYLFPTKGFLTNMYEDDYEQNGLVIKESLQTSETREYKITGFYKRPSVYVQPYNSPSFIAITKRSADDYDGNMTFGIRLKDTDDYESQISSFMGAYVKAQLSAEGEMSADFNLGMLEFEKFGSTRLGQVLYSMIMIVIIIVILTSIYVIRNSFAISVQEKTRQYGMLSSIGATSGQIRKSVLYEGLILGIIGIPAGVLLGIGAVFVLIKILNVLLSDVVGGRGFVYSFEPVVFLITALGSIVTILLSCLLPAIRASKITPIAAIRNNEEIKLGKKDVKSSGLVKKLFGIGGVIAGKNLRRNRKKYRTTVVSLVISVSVFIGLSSFVDYMKAELRDNISSTDYNIRIAIPNGENDRKEVYQAIVTSLGVDDYSCCDQYYDTRCDMSPYFSEHTKNNAFTYAPMTEIYRPTIYVFNQQYFEKYCTSLGIKGGYDDTAVLYNAAADYSGRSEKRSEPVYDIEDGTAIHLGIAKKMQGSENAADPEYVEKEIMITKVTDTPPRGYENVFTDGGFLMVSEHFFTDEEKELYDYYTDDLFIQAEDADELQKELEDLKMSGSPYNQIMVTNSNEEVRTSKNLMLAIEIFLYGFITVITLIGVTNIFNTISTGMSLRAREFAMLRSVGMTNREFNRMIRLESFMYGSKSLLIGLPAGILISILFYIKLGRELHAEFIFPFKAVLISIAAVFIIVFITMHYSVSRIGKQNIIETIRRENV